MFIVLHFANMKLKSYVYKQMTYVLKNILASLIGSLHFTKMVNLSNLICRLNNVLIEFQWHVKNVAKNHSKAYPEKEIYKNRDENHKRKHKENHASYQIIKRILKLNN